MSGESKREKGKYDAEKFKEAGIQYILQPITCGDDSETFTVRQYLEMFGIPVDDPFFHEWQSLLYEVSTFIRKLEKMVSEKTMQTIWATVLVGIYLDYDTDKPFMPQFLRNKDNLLIAVNTVRQAMSIL